MAKRTKLTAVVVKGMKLAGKYPDGQHGLILRINAGGSKGWIQRIKLNSGKTQDVGLGSYPAVTLPQARVLARENVARVDTGKAPMGKSARKARTEAKAKPRATVERMAQECAVELRRLKWTRDRTQKIFEQRFNDYINPIVGSKDIGRVTELEVKELCVAIATDRPQTARRVRIVCSQIFEYAIEQGHARRNRAPKSIDKHLVNVNTPKSQNRLALHWLDVPDAMERIINGPSDEVTQLAYLFTVLNANRHGEVRKARWSEFDLRNPANPLWVIDGSRMKAGHTHTVPLSRQSVAILNAMRAYGDADDDYVFPSVTSKYGHLSDTTFRGANQTAQLSTTMHGYRSSFRDWAEENTRYSRLAMELSLSHVSGDSTERAYRRTEVLEQRRSLMTEWADYILPMKTLTPFLSD